jgi:uncharacterized protein (TIGR00369 family)
VLNEPVRGAHTEPGFYSLSGLEQLRASLRGHFPLVPVFRLMGGRITQVSSGTVVFIQSLSPWFELNHGFVELSFVAEMSVFVTAVSTAPPGVRVRVVDLSLRYLRPCTVDDETVLARGHVLHAGSSFTTVETLLEDGLGRAVAHATGSVVIEPIDPPPPPLSHPLQPVEEPVYPTPDPHRRRVPPRPPVLPGVGLPWPAIAELLGVEYLEIAGGRAKTTMAVSEWFCRLYRDVSSGILATLAALTGGGAAGTVLSPDQYFVVLNLASTFLKAVDLRTPQLVANGAVRRHGDEVMMIDMEVTDAGGDTVLVGHGTLMVGRHAARTGPVDRVLLSVLFTDLVGSTDQARRLGDARWHDLLEQHNTIVRRQLELHKGREVKTTGDGFLATFESPTRAVQCARAVRDGVARLGLDIRAGIHTGDCEVARGDVSGLAVHVASRVQSIAGPGEILVSGTVRELVTGSGLSLSDRGMHDLKGLEGKWQLYALDD